MKINKVKVRYAETVSIPGYRNARPEVEIEAEVHPDEEENDRQILMDRARNQVQGAIDDFLEANEMSPQYFSGPLYDIATVYNYIDHGYRVGGVAVIPFSVGIPPGARRQDRPRRYDTAVRGALKMMRENEIPYFDCTDGDMTEFAEFISDFIRNNGPADYDDDDDEQEFDF